MSRKYWLLLIAVIIAGGLIYYYGQNKYGNSIYNPVAAPSASATAKPPTGYYRPAKSAAPSAYSEVVRQFGNNRIQFDALCHGLPDQLVLKKGTKMMLDNRSADTKTISWEGYSTVIGGYNYTIATLTTNKPIPQSIGMDCRSKNGSTVNTVVITLE